MKTALAAAVVALFLSLPLYASAAVATGDVGTSTIRYWLDLNDSKAQLFFLMGALDVLIISCPGDIATVGAMQNVLHNRINGGTVKLTDRLYNSINHIALDFGCSTILSR